MEIHDRQQLASQLASGSLAHVVVQGLDLSDVDLSHVEVAGAVLLGCRLRDSVAVELLARGALLFPALPQLPYNPYRPRLYHAAELMSGYRRGEHESYARTLDQRIYQHYVASRRKRPPAVLDTLAQRLHDHAIDDALADFLGRGEARKVIAIMGGHAMRRGEAAYADVARIARAVARRDAHYLMTSGGGPGAMEATHLGAWLAGAPDNALDEALALLAPAPDLAHTGWLDAAFEVRERWPDCAADSLGIPTWFYGHEPPNVFATHIAKYFSNSLREDGLLGIATHGVIYAPGSAGTIQEVFMDAAQNHYGTFELVSPMIFYGVKYWTETKPVYPLLENLARGKQYADLLFISDDVDEIVARLVEHPPVPYSGQAPRPIGS
ncbi:MAG: hypothetical protein KC503_24495 [Myxococcales bacterium]|nr:hypothetical protein [Myxococcales bacterium]